MAQLDVDKTLKTIKDMGLSPAMQRNQAQTVADNAFMAGGPEAAKKAYAAIAAAGLAPKLTIDVIRQEGPEALKTRK